MLYFQYYIVLLIFTGIIFWTINVCYVTVEDKIRDNEAVKLIRFKEGLLHLSQAYIELGRKCSIIFEAQKDISVQLPNVLEKDLEDIKYTGINSKYMDMYQ